MFDGSEDAQGAVFLGRGMCAYTHLRDFVLDQVGLWSSFLLALDTIDFLFFFFCYNVFAQADASPFMVSLLMSSLSRSSFHEGCLHVVTDDFRHAIKLLPMAAQARVQSCMSQGYGAWYYDLQRKTFSVANGFDPYTL